MMGREERKTADMLDRMLSRSQSGRTPRHELSGDGGHSRELQSLVELALKGSESRIAPNTR